MRKRARCASVRSLGGMRVRPTRGMLRRGKFPGRGVVLDQGLRPHVLPAGSAAAAAAVIQIGRPFAVRCAVQVHLSHNVPGFHFVRAVRVMRTAVLGPGIAPGLRPGAAERIRGAEGRRKAGRQLRREGPWPRLDGAPRVRLRLVHGAQHRAGRRGEAQRFAPGERLRGAALEAASGRRRGPQVAQHIGVERATFWWPY